MSEFIVVLVGRINGEIVVRSMEAKDELDSMCASEDLMADFCRDSDPEYEYNGFLNTEAVYTEINGWFLFARFDLKLKDIKATVTIYKF